MEAQAYILIVTTFGKTKEVSNKLITLDFVENVHELYGQYDIIVKVKVPTLKELEKTIQERIRSISEIQRTETLVVSDAPS